MADDKVDAEVKQRIEKLLEEKKVLLGKTKGIMAKYKALLVKNKANESVIGALKGSLEAAKQEAAEIDSESGNEEEIKKLKQKLEETKKSTKTILVKYKKSLVKNKEQGEQIIVLQKEVGGRKKTDSGEDAAVLETQVAGLALKLEEAKEKLKQQVQQAKDASKSHLALENENSQLSWTLKDMKKRANEAELGFQQAREESEKWKSAAERRKDKVEELTITLEGLKEEMSGVGSISEERRLEIVSITDEFQKYRSRAAMAMKEVQQKADTEAQKALTAELEMVKKDFEKTRNDLDCALVDMKIEQEEKDGLRKELLETLERVKIVDSVKEKDSQIDGLNKTIAEMKLAEEQRVVGQRGMEKKHQLDLKSKTEMARKTLVENEMTIQSLRAEIKKGKEARSVLEQNIENLNAKLSRKESAEDQARLQQEKEEEAHNAIVRMAQEQARRDAAMTTSEQRITSLTSEIKVLKESNVEQSHRLETLQKKYDAIYRKSSQKDRENESRLKREIDLGKDVSATIQGTTPENETFATPEKTPASPKESMRQATNVEYLKNCLFGFLSSESQDEQRSMLPVLATILHFTAEELDRAKHALEVRSQGLFGSALNFVTSYATASSGSNSPYIRPN
jgi:DNA repair exonuclease SbcCD ATPase subunit